VQRFLACLPIFNAARVVYGYELLFRSGPENRYDAVHEDMASASTVDNILLFGMERLIPGCRAFLNCTRDFLIRDFATMLPKDRVVLEILETVPTDDEVHDACRRLKQAGYQLALDDFEERPDWKPLVDIADYIKVDLLATTPADQLHLAQTYLPMNIRLAAEKVETYDDFHRTRRWGYAYFQGYFFSRPEMLTRRDIPANQMNYLLVLQAANRAQMDIDEVSARIKAEASLSFRLLRYLNSPAFPPDGRSALHSPRARAAGRTRHPEVGFADCRDGPGQRETGGTGGFAADSCAILRVTGALRAARGIGQRSFPSRPVIRDGRNSEHAHAGRAAGKSPFTRKFAMR
jgi:c-di-GMP-related signal transduction protein